MACKIKKIVRNGFWQGCDKVVVVCDCGWTRDLQMYDNKLMTDCCQECETKIDLTGEVWDGTPVTSSPNEDDEANDGHF